MKKALIILLIFFANTVNPLSAQEIVPACKNGKWGHIDLWGNTVIPFIFDDARPFLFDNKTAAVKMRGKWGYTNRAGRIVVPCRYQEVEDYCEGLKKVKLNGKWGVINDYGRNLIVPQFDTLITQYSAYLLGKLGDKTRVYYKGKEISSQKYDNYELTFGDYVIAGKNNLYGLIDSLGQEVVPPEYGKIEYRHNHYYQLGSSLFINPTKKDTLTRSAYYSYDPYKYGYKPFNQDDGYVYLNREGKNIFGKYYLKAYGFSDGVAEVINLDHIRQYIDTSGNVLFDAPKGYRIGGFYDGYAVCRNNSSKHLYGIINKKGEIIIEPAYERLSFEGNYFVGEKEDQEYYINSLGRLLDYSTIEYFQKGVYLVERNGKWGLADSLFNEMIPTIYDKIESSFDRLLCVCSNGKWGFLDQSGNEVIPFIYEDAIDFQKELAIVKYKGKYGIIDKKNRCRVKFEFDQIQKGWSVAYVKSIPMYYSIIIEEEEEEVSLNN